MEAALVVQCTHFADGKTEAQRSKQNQLRLQSQGEISRRQDPAPDIHPFLRCPDRCRVWACEPEGRELGLGEALEGEVGTSSSKKEEG